MTPQITTEVNRPNVPPSGTTITAEVDVEPGEQTEQIERHIALCIDTSGSMSGEKIQRARDGASWVFGLLEPDDYISIVGFNSEAKLHLRPTQWRNIDREMAMNQVDDLAAGGGTNMFEGLRTAQNALESLGMWDETNDKTAVRRILLLSDGKDKHHDPPEFRDLAMDIDESGIRVEAAGIGEDYNQETIRTLGTTARGEWTHLEGPGDIEDFFGEAVEEAQSVVATDAQLELDVSPGVEVTDVYRALPQAQDADLDWETNRAVVKLPDLTEREHQRVVMKIHVPERSDDEETVDLADVTLTASGGQASERIRVTYTEDNTELAEHKEEVQLDHQQTVIQTELGKGNVENAETQIEKMTQIHGKETEIVQEVERQTQLVKEGGRAERNRATKIIDDEDGIQK
ncbi:MAG: Ca-activated chloride channel family protein [Haloarculaceae archaeon]|jgi:Ca-activated chloride channel family protein